MIIACLWSCLLTPHRNFARSRARIVVCNCRLLGRYTAIANFSTNHPHNNQSPMLLTDPIVRAFLTGRFPFPWKRAWQPWWILGGINHQVELRVYNRCTCTILLHLGRQITQTITQTYQFPRLLLSNASLCLDGRWRGPLHYSLIDTHPFWIRSRVLKEFFISYREKHVAGFFYKQSHLNYFFVI